MTQFLVFVILMVLLNMATKLKTKEKDFNNCMRGDFYAKEGAIFTEEKPKTYSRTREVFDKERNTPEEKER